MDIRPERAAVRGPRYSWTLKRGGREAQTTRRKRGRRPKLLDVPARPIRQRRLVERLGPL